MLGSQIPQYSAIEMLYCIQSVSHKVFVCCRKLTIFTCFEKIKCLNFRKLAFSSSAVNTLHLSLEMKEFWGALPYSKVPQVKHFVFNY